MSAPVPVPHTTTAASVESAKSAAGSVSSDYSRISGSKHCWAAQARTAVVEKDVKGLNDVEGADQARIKWQADPRQLRQQLLLAAKTQTHDANAARVYVRVFICCNLRSLGRT